jgi:hypothetical protein
MQAIRCCLNTQRETLWPGRKSPELSAVVLMPNSKYQIQRIMEIQHQNPWDLIHLKDLKRCYYVCPECHAMIPDSERFLRHAGDHPFALEFLLRNIQNTNNSEFQQLSVIKSEPLDEVRDKHDSTLKNLDRDDFDPDVLLRDSANLNDTFIAQATLECAFNNQTSSRDIEHISLLRPSAKRKNDDSNMPGTKPRTFRPYLSNSAAPKKPKDITAAARPFSCSKCRHRSKTQDKLERHILSHTSPRDSHQCKFCDKKFVFKNSMTKHLEKGRCDVLKQRSNSFTSGQLPTSCDMKNSTDYSTVSTEDLDFMQ